MSRSQESVALIAIPTFNAEVAAGLETLVDRLGPLGVVHVVCNSASAERSLRQMAIPHVQPGTNLGFGGTANHVATLDRSESLGILVMNDDALPTSDAVAEMHRSITRCGRRGVIGFGHPDGPVGPPGVTGTLARVTSLWAIRRLLPHRWRGRSFPFHAAFVGWDTFDALGGFDTDRFPLYFEDSDLIRRAQTSASVEVVDVSIEHTRSATSRHVPETTALLAFGARNYLSRHCHVPPAASQVLIRGALCVRALVELARLQPARASVAFKAARGRLSVAPALPRFDS